MSVIEKRVFILGPFPIPSMGYLQNYVILEITIKHQFHRFSGCSKNTEFDWWIHLRGSQVILLVTCLGKNPLTTWNAGGTLITVHVNRGNNYEQLDFIHLHLSYDQKPLGELWCDISSSTNFLNPVSGKMPHLSQWTWQYLSQSIWANYNSQTWILFRHFGQIDFPNPSKSYKWFQSMISMYN